MEVRNDVNLKCKILLKIVNFLYVFDLLNKIWFEYILIIENIKRNEI